MYASSIILKAPWFVFFLAYKVIGLQDSRLVNFWGIRPINSVSHITSSDNRRQWRVSGTIYDRYIDSRCARFEGIG